MKGIKDLNDQKVNKTNYNKCRPFAVTSVRSKLIWEFIRDSVEEHVFKWGLSKLCQTGFKSGGRIEFNLFLLQSIICNAMKGKQILSITVDFKKDIIISSVE